MRVSAMAARALSLLAAAAVAGGLAVSGSPLVEGASPSPAADSSIVMTAEPLLSGNFRAGSWAAVRVHLENDGPAVDGELRLATSDADASTFSLPVQLPSGARQEHVLYGQTRAFGRRFTVSLVSGDGATLRRANVPITAADWSALGVYVVAERPQDLVGGLSDAASAAGGADATVATVTPEGLPPRAEAWSSMDLLVWQDVDSNRFGIEQQVALRTWVLQGGDLVVLGGSTGTATLAAFPAELLPYRPSGVVDVPPADLTSLIGTPPVGASSVPALSGTLERGIELARSGDAVIAARTNYGRGTVGIVGIDPATPWIASSASADAVWSRVIPPGLTAQQPSSASGEGFIVSALNSLPAVQLPQLDHVFLLILAYVVAIGPVNYLILRRRDRREWAWLTMPATIVVFAVGAYGFGVALKGSSVVVNELAVVRGAAGTDQGLAQVYVGVYSPGRANFDVRVAGDPLISAPSISTGPWDSEEEPAPVDVLLGETATVRNYGVGYGSLRAFRAETEFESPRMDTDLSLTDGALAGTITNASQVPLSGVALVYGNAFRRLGDMAPGESRTVDMAAGNDLDFGEPLAWRLYPDIGQADAATIRTVSARRAVIQHLSGGWDWEVGGRGVSSGELGASGPVVLAWVSGPTLAIDVGTEAERIGERLFVLPARARVMGNVVFSGGLLQRSIVAIESDEAWQEGGLFVMALGTMAVDYRPAGMDGSFYVSSLSLRFDFGPGPTPAAQAREIAPLPAEEQPDTDAPLASEPRPGEGQPDIPRLQLFDRVAAAWVEFEPMSRSVTYAIPEPGLYVDEAGALHVRFVARGVEYSEFSFGVRMEGTVK